MASGNSNSNINNHDNVLTPSPLPPSFSQSSYSLSEGYYRNFKNSCKAVATFESYNNKLNKYMKYRGYTQQHLQPKTTTIVVTQLPSRNANKQRQKVDLITQKNRNVQT
jgi:hypothetical protein